MAPLQVLLLLGLWIGVPLLSPELAGAHEPGAVLVLPAPPLHATLEEQRFAAEQAAVILTATPSEHRQALAAAWRSPAQALMQWDLHPSVLIGTALLAVAYALAVLKLSRSGGLAGRVRARQVVYFAASLVLLLALLNGPVLHLSDFYLLSVHMVQHMALALLFPPLFLAGLPGEIFTPLLRQPVFLRLGRVLTHPVMAYGLFNASLIGWHLPPAYEYALRNHTAHIAQHLMFLVVAVLVWWPIAGPAPELPRLSYFWQIGYLFVLQIPMVALGAFLTLAKEPIYPFYAAAPRVFAQLPALEDQQLAGLFMWLPGHLVLWIPMAVLFFRWFASGRDDATGLPPASVVVH